MRVIFRLAAGPKVRSSRTGTQSYAFGTTAKRVAVVLLLGVVSTVFAADDEPQDQRKEFPSIKIVLGERIAKIEKDLAAKMMRRGDAPAGGAPLELQIDLRVIQRWLLTQAANSKPESDVQIAALLRSMQLASAMTQLEERMKGSEALTKIQNDSMAQVHRVSFELGELQGVAQLDDICKKVGYAMENIANREPMDASHVPVMRPKRLGNGKGAAMAPADVPRTPAELSTEITRLAVSQPLRQQLLAVAKAAGAAAADPARAKEAAALGKMLALGVDLARGLSGTTAFSQQARADIEAQLAEGLALFSDPRTRSAGQVRIEQLSQYRNVMNRIGRSSLSAEMRSALGPALAYAQTHAEQGAAVLDVIDQFAAICAKYDVVPRRDNPIANLRKPTEELARQIEAARQGFIAATRDLGSGLLAVTPEALESQIADLRSLVDLYVVLDRMQQTFDTLSAYKPRPFGGIEGRAQKAALAATSIVKGQGRADAMRFLFDLDKLARLSESLAKRLPVDVPATVAQQYAGVSMSEFESKVRSMMADLVSQVATGVELDKSNLARLHAVGDLCDSLRAAASFERSLEAVPSLGRWVDWTLTTEQLRALNLPYQQSMTAAFTGFVSDTPDVVEKFLRLRHGYLPLIAMLANDVECAMQCGELPDGLAGELARLMTPLDGQPFATERYVSYAVSVWTLLAPTEPDAAAIAVEYAMKRLQRDVKVR